MEESATQNMAEKVTVLRHAEDYTGELAGPAWNICFLTLFLHTKQSSSRLGLGCLK